VKNMEENEIMQMFNFDDDGNNDTQSLEEHLIKQILNPVKLERHRIKIDNNMPNGVVFELREGTAINEAGYPEDLHELVINPNVFPDGSSMNFYGITMCPLCQSNIHEDSRIVCQCCGAFCCKVKGCAKYSWFQDKWFCSTKCKVLSFFKIRLG